MIEASRFFLSRPMSLWILLSFVLTGSLHGQVGSHHDITTETHRFRGEHIEVQLVSARRGLAPGQAQEFAVRLIPDPKWHVYWRNPGDSGEAPSLTMLEPEGWTVGPFSWPSPDVIPLPPLVNFGYKGEVWLPFRIEVPLEEQGPEVTLRLQLYWLVCEVNCIPGQQVFELTLPLSPALSEEPSPWQPTLDFVRSQLPRETQSWSMQDGDGEVLTIDVPRKEIPASWDEIYFLPWEATGLATQGHTFESHPDRLSIRALWSGVEPQQPPSGLLLFYRAGAHGAQEKDVLVLAPRSPQTQAGTDQGLALMLIFAFLGGLILNVMPCVLPVLAIKLVSFAQEQDQRGLPSSWSGLAYTVGVLLSFLALAGGLLLLQSTGQSVGWGFQLQSPIFVSFLAVLFFLLACNVLGLLNPWDGLTRLGAIGQNQVGLLGRFLSGVLATLVASPCTGPFMAVALGFALTQPPLPALALFFALGLGFASPVLVLGFLPGARRFVPKPGPWMETLRQFFAFPLFGTTLWLLWVLEHQRGSDLIFVILSGLVAIAMCLWWYRRLDETRRLHRGLARLSSVLAILLTILSPLWIAKPVAKGSAESEQAGAWERFSPETLERLRGQYPVFVDFTAAWCVSCQVNKVVALEQKEVMTAFAARNVRLLRADWTDYNPTIAQVLKEYGRSGVPLYLLFQPGQPQPIILPELLSPAIILAALDKLEDPSSALPDGGSEAGQSITRP